MDQTSAIDPAIAAFSLKDTCKQRLKGMLITLRHENPNIMAYILVVDESTVKIISAYMKMAELMEMGITAIEKLELGRKPFPKMNAIYFISPTERSVSHVIQDFADKKEPQYAVVHLFFSNKLEQSQMQKIAASETLIQRVQTFKVFSLDFCCQGEGVFSLEFPDALINIFSSRGITQRNVVYECANKLATLLISFDKFYSFEMMYNICENKVSEDVARATETRLQELLKSFEKSNSDQYDRIEKSCGKITVIIVDRAIDPMTPLLHDFFYQPMVYDLLNVENDICEYQQDAANGAKVNKKMVLSDLDELFKRYRYKHIGEVLEGVPLEFRNFVNTNTTARVQQGQLQNLDLNKMSEIVKSMPQYNELLSKYTFHMKLIERSWSIFEKKDLREIGELEQSLATGIDNNGKAISPIKILNQVGMKLLNDQLDDFDKIRLLLITTIALEMVEKDRKTLTDKINPDMQTAVLNLIYLGVSAQKDANKKFYWYQVKSTNRVADNIKKMAKNKMASATMDLCRHTPIIESIVQEVVESGMKRPSKFQSLYVNEEGSSKTGGVKSLRKKGKLAQMMANEADADAINNMNKLIVFVVGGIGYNEIRSIISNPKICNSQITIVGGTKLIKPNDYVQGLLNLKRE